MGSAVIGLDLDGVLWRGSEPIEGSAAAVDTLRLAGFRVAFLTNNANPTLESYVHKLAGMGIIAEPADLVTSAQAVATVLARELPTDARVLVCGGPGLVEAVSIAGFDVVAESPAEAVVVGYDPGFDYESLDRASEVVRSGAHFIAANVDPTFPSSHRLLPGNGALVAAIATAGGAQPTVAGKPEPPYTDLVSARFGDRGVMVGDRPSTDGALAAALGWPFALVLSGVAGPGGEEDVPDPAPAFVADDLARLCPQLIGG